MVSYGILRTVVHLNAELNHILSYTEAQRSPELGSRFLYYTDFVLQKIYAGYKIYPVHKLDRRTQVGKFIHTQH